jgi:hypothetical protein
MLKSDLINSQVNGGEQVAALASYVTCNALLVLELLTLCGCMSIEHMAAFA